MSKEVLELIKATNEYIELLETYKSCTENKTFTGGMLMAKIDSELSDVRDKWITKRTILEIKEL